MDDDIDKIALAASKAIIRSFDDVDPSSIITKYAFVIEYARPDGSKGLSRVTGPAGSTIWDARGLWFEALHGDWPSDDPSE